MEVDLSAGRVAERRRHGRYGRGEPTVRGVRRLNLVVLFVGVSRTARRVHTGSLPAGWQGPPGHRGCRTGPAARRDPPEESLGRSEPDIRLAVGAISDPDLRRGLEELGMIGGVSVSKREVVVELLRPVEGWPPAAELAEKVRLAVVEPEGGEGESRQARSPAGR